MMDERGSRMTDVNARYFFTAADRIIKCRRCGNCCSKFDNVLIKKREMKSIASYLRISTSKLKRRYNITHHSPRLWSLPGNPCAFLDGSHCSIYDIRPNTCRAFPFLAMMYTAMSPGKGKVKFQMECPKSVALLNIVRHPRGKELIEINTKWSRAQYDHIVALMVSHEETQ